jgi:hypothetical protein
MQAVRTENVKCCNPIALIDLYECESDKSQLADAESPASDRIAFAQCPLETGLRKCPPEKSKDSDRLRCWAVRSLQSGLHRNNREIRAFFAYFVSRGAEFLCSSDCVAERQGFEPSVQV